MKRRQITFAKELRRNQTEAEKLLWSKLRNMQIDGFKFRRQQPVGNCIVDFVCFGKKLIIEIDGGQHNMDQIKNTDDLRKVWLEAEGYKVLRSWNNDALLNLEGVLTLIKESLG